MFESAIVNHAAHGTGDLPKPLPGKLSVVVSNTGPELKGESCKTDMEASGLAFGRDESVHAAPSSLAIRQQVARILKSSVFIHSDRLSRFLQFIVEHALGGTQNYLKEYVIGSEVYDRKPPYNPSQDSIVRTEARRLRGKLKEYYETKGKDDPIRVNLYPGSYVPVFHSSYRQASLHSSSNSNGAMLATSQTATAILPFRDISGSMLSATYARGIPDELAYTLMQISGCKVISPASMAYFIVQERNLAAAMSRAGAQIAYEGSVREEGNHIRVTASIVDAAGFQLWTKRFDAEAGSLTLFTIEEQIASALSAGFDALFGESKALYGS